MKAEVVKLADENIKLRQDFQGERNRKVALAENAVKELRVKIIYQKAQIEGLLEKVKHEKENIRIEKEEMQTQIKFLEEKSTKMYE